MAPLSVPLVVNSMKQTEGTNNGGYINIIHGLGFQGQDAYAFLMTFVPSPDTTDVTVEVCNQSASIQFVTHSTIGFYMPPCPQLGNRQVTVTKDVLQDDSLFFNYTEYVPNTMPTVHSLSPSSSNPKLKRNLTIIGNHFETNTSELQILMAQDQGKVYELTVLEHNTTHIIC